jgi:hypothetical protein
LPANPRPSAHAHRKSKPWEGEKFAKGYPNEPHPELLKLFAEKKKAMEAK